VPTRRLLSDEDCQSNDGDMHLIKGGNRVIKF
jgi:hypothetical protein